MRTSLSYLTDHYWPPKRNDPIFRSYIPEGILVIFNIPVIFGTFFLMHSIDIVALLFFLLAYNALCQFLWYYFMYTRTRTPISQSKFLQILERAKEKTSMRTVEALLSKERRTILTSATTPFQQCVLLSKKAADRIEDHPLEGEIVMAYELFNLKRESVWLNILRNLAVAIFYSTLAFLLPEIVWPLLQLLEQIPLWIPAVVLSYPWGFGIAAGFHRKFLIEQEVEALYGKHPEIALFEVFANKEMTTSGRRHYLEEIQSRIEKRESSSILSAIGFSLIISVIIIIIAYSILSLTGIPAPFIGSIALMLGGISFSLFTYLSSSKGRGGIHHPDIEIDRPPLAEDEASREVGRLLSMKENSETTMIMKYPSFFGDDESLYEIAVGDDAVLMSEQDWDVLEDPELISSFLAGELAIARSGLKSRTLLALGGAFLVMMIGGLLYLIVMLRSSLFSMVAWIAFSFVVLACLYAALKILSLRRSIRTEFAVARREPNYLEALRRISLSNDVSDSTRWDAKRRLRNMESRLTKIENSDSDKEWDSGGNPRRAGSQ